MDTVINPGVVTVVTATATEARAARKALEGRDVRIVEAGISLSRGRRFENAAISCGLAGGLKSGLATGTILIPSSVQRPDGSVLECDAELSARLRRAARELGYDSLDAPLLTGAALIYGDARAEWASRGFAGVDMETGLIEAPRVACVRVVLDTPEREISPRWLRPATAMLHPSAWRDLPFLAREGPRCAERAARVIAGALR